jgi:hypothetical protein
MILTPLKYDLANLFNSDEAVAVCPAEGQRLKNLVLLVRDAGWGVVVVETASGDHYVIARAGRDGERNLLGDTRRWNREHGYRFSVKRADERISTSPEDIMALPDGVGTVFTRASSFTQWGLSKRQILPESYVRL